MISMGQYERLMRERPKKFKPAQVGYQRGEGSQTCEHCMHFYTRELDGFSVCEIMRSEETDEEGVNPLWVCDFFTPDGEQFPVREQAEAEVPERVSMIEEERRAHEEGVQGW